MDTKTHATMHAVTHLTTHATDATHGCLHSSEVSTLHSFAFFPCPDKFLPPTTRTSMYMADTAHNNATDNARDQ